MSDGKRISIEETAHVAKLSMLEFSDSELETLNGEMDRILETVSALDSVPTEGLEATLSVGAYANRFRDDVCLPTLSREDALSNAPRSRDGAFEITRILSKTNE